MELDKNHPLLLQELTLLQIAMAKKILRIEEFLMPKKDDKKMTKEDWEKLMDF